MIELEDKIPTLEEMKEQIRTNQGFSRQMQAELERFVLSLDAVITHEKPT